MYMNPSCFIFHLLIITETVFTLGLKEQRPFPDSHLESIRKTWSFIIEKIINHFIFSSQLSNYFLVKQSIVINNKLSTWLLNALPVYYSNTPLAYVKTPRIRTLSANLSRSSSHPITFPRKLIQQGFLKSTSVETTWKSKMLMNLNYVLDMDQIQKIVHRRTVCIGLQYFPNNQDVFKYKILFPLNFVI